MIGLLHTMANIERIMVSIQRCFQLFELPQEAKDQTKVKDPEWPQKGEIIIRDVELKYRPKTERVLKGLNVQV